MDQPHRDAGTRLYLVRRSSGMSVADLARNLGCTPSLVFAWESGREFPSPPELGALARVLGVALEELSLNR